MNQYIFLTVLTLKLVVLGKSDKDNLKFINARITEDDWLKFLAKEQDKNGLDLFSRRYLGKKNWLVTFHGNQSTIDLLKNSSIKYKVLDYKQPTTDKATRKSYSQEISFTEYATFDNIMKYIKKLTQKSKPYREISVVTVGSSTQGRDIKMVKIKHPHATNIMFFDATIHAREWLSTMTGLYLLHRLVGANKESSINNVNWHIIPCLNPDGYVETFKPGKRFQRKNMNKRRCPQWCHTCGVDLNRNFGYKFGRKLSMATIKTFVYIVVRQISFSEPEAQALRKALHDHLDDIKLYITLHSYGRTLLYPWGYADQPCDDWEDLQAAGMAASEAIKKVSKTHTGYSVENSGKGGTIYAAAGGSDDYAKSIGIKYSYTMEVQEGGHTGFDPPPSVIHGYVKENYVGIVALAKYINQRSENRIRAKTLMKKNTLYNSAVHTVSATVHITIYVSLFVFKINCM